MLRQKWPYILSQDFNFNSSLNIINLARDFVFMSLKFEDHLPRWNYHLCTKHLLTYFLSKFFVDEGFVRLWCSYCISTEAKENLGAYFKAEENFLMIKTVISYVFKTAGKVKGEMKEFIFLVINDSCLSVYFDIFYFLPSPRLSNIFLY